MPMDCSKKARILLLMPQQEPEKPENLLGLSRLSSGAFLYFGVLLSTMLKRVCVMKTPLNRKMDTPGENSAITSKSRVHTASTSNADTNIPCREAQPGRKLRMEIHVP